MGHMLPTVEQRRPQQRRKQHIQQRNSTADAHQNTTDQQAKDQCTAWTSDSSRHTSPTQVQTEWNVGSTRNDTRKRDDQIRQVKSGKGSNMLYNVEQQKATSKPERDRQESRCNHLTDEE